MDTATASRAWWAVVCRFLLHGLIVSTWVSRIPAVKGSLGLGNAQFGLCLLGTAIGSVISAMVTGWLVSRFGSKVVTIWSTAGFALALVLPAFAANAATLFLCLLVYGAFAGANDVAMNSQAVAVEALTGTPSMSRFHAMFSIGGMVGAVLGGWMALAGMAPVEHLSIASLLFLGICWFSNGWLLEARDQAPARSERPSFGRIPARALALAAIGMCLFVSEGAVADWAGVYLKQDLFANAATTAAGYAAFSAGMATFRLLGDWITKQLGPVMTLRIGAVISAAGLSGALATHSTMWALIGFALTGVGFSVIVPLAFAAGGRVEELPPGAGIALVSGSGYAGFLFGPPLIGMLAQVTSLRSALFSLVLLSAVAGCLSNAVRHTSGELSIRRRGELRGVGATAFEADQA